jgi:hypothetical protein
MSSAVVIALLCAISTSIGACVGCVVAGILAAGRDEPESWRKHQPSPAPRRTRHHNRREPGGFSA